MRAPSASTLPSPKGEHGRGLRDGICGVFERTWDELTHNLLTIAFVYNQYLSKKLELACKPHESSLLFVFLFAIFRGEKKRPSQGGGPLKIAA